MKLPHWKLLVGGFACFVVGAVSTIAFQSWGDRDRSQEEIFSGFTRSPLKLDDPFSMLDEMEKRLGDPFASPSWLSLPTPTREVKRTEDDRYVYYEVQADGLDQQSLKISVKDGQIDISGKIEKKTEDPEAQSVMTSSFRQRFTVPPEVDPDRAVIEPQSDRVVIKLPKVTG